MCSAGQRLRSETAVAALAVSGDLTIPLSTSLDVAEDVVVLTGRLIYAGLYDIKVGPWPVLRERTANVEVQVNVYRPGQWPTEQVTPDLRPGIDIQGRALDIKALLP